MKGLSSLIFFESLSITERSAPTYGAKSILFITNRSERVIPGPPFLGILSPSATSITNIVASDNSGLNVADKLSPPLSINIISRSKNLLANSSTASRFIEASSLIAV